MDDRDSRSTPPTRSGGMAAADRQLLYRICWGVMACAFVITLAVLQLYILHFSRPYFTSDDAVVNSLAGSMWEQGRLFPDGWINNNGDLMVPSGALIVAPLLAWLPNGFMVHAITGVFATVFMMVAFAWFLRSLRMPWSVVVLLATLIAGGLSLSFEWLLFVQTTYLWWPAGFFIGASIILLHRRRTDTAPRPTFILPAALALLVFFISIANPGRVLVMMVGPLYVFDRLVAQGMRPTMQPKLIRRWAQRMGWGDPLTLMGIVGAFLAATVVYSLLSHYRITQASYGAAALRWGGWPSVIRHARTFEGWFSFLGAPVGSIAAGDALDFVIRLFRWCVAIGLTWVGVSEVVRLPWQRDAVRRALGAALLAATVPIGLIYLLFDPLAVNASTMRYFIVPYCIALVLAAFPIRHALARFPCSAIVSLAIACVLFVFDAARIYLPPPASMKADFWHVHRSPSQELADTLMQEGLKWGYATWWNAGAATVQADSAVHVVPVSFSTSAIVPFPSMVSEAWYRPDAWNGQTFLALLKGEASDVRIQSLLYVLGKPVRTIESDRYRILVFDRNISVDFGKSTQSTTNVRIHPGDSTPRLVSAQLLTGRSSSPMLSVVIRNETAFTISGAGRYAFSIGIRLLDPKGATIDQDWVHWPLNASIDPGGEAAFEVPLPPTAPANRIRIDLVQERVAWLEDMGVAPIDMSVDPDVIFGAPR